MVGRWRCQRSFASFTFSAQKGVHVNTTEYLARQLAADAETLRQARSLINERGYETETADRLHTWVSDHMTIILSPPVVSNPYPEPWPNWMMDILTATLGQVDWNELVKRLR